MRCPNCEAPVADPGAAFCSRCGHPLSSEETEATARLDVPLSDEISEVRPTTEERAPEQASLVTDYTEVLRRRFLTSWLDPIGAACLSFLVLMALGALLLVAAKLQYPSFGAGANPIEILSSITIVGLAILRVPVHVGDLVVSVLPLGALVAAGAGIVWATSVTAKDRSPRSAIQGAAVGIPFALVCFLAALVFRFGGRNEVFAGALGALFWGLAWGSAFGALGVVVGRGRTTLWRAVTQAGGKGVVHRGVAAASIALGSAAALAAAAMLLWVIVALIRGAPGPKFGAGDALAAFVYLFAFGPNVMVSLIALGVGAPVYVGARVTVAGSGVGDVQRIWMFGEAPGYVGFLMLIPLLACSLAGFWLRRTSSSASFPRELPVFAAVFASVLALLAWLGEARLGASLLGRGIARLDVDAPATFALAFLWALAAGFAGWWLADRAGSGSRA